MMYGYLCGAFWLYFRESKLTQYLRDEIGGNFKTRVFVCLKPHCEVERLEAVLQFATKFSQVKNYPVLNDYLTQVSLNLFSARACPDSWMI